MSECKLCRQDMNRVEGCKNDKVIKFSDVSLDAVKAGESSDFTDSVCHDCGASVGEPHHVGCDVERCPRCEGQLISCDCVVVLQKIVEA